MLSHTPLNLPHLIFRKPAIQTSTLWRLAIWSGILWCTACSGSKDLSYAVRQERANRFAEKAVHCVEKGRLNEATRWAWKAVAMDSANSTAYTALGRAYNKGHWYDSTVVELRRGIPNGAASATVWFELAVASEELSLVNEAIQAYEEVTRRDTVHVQGLFRLARMYYQTGELRRAFVLAEKAMHLIPDDEEIQVLYQTVLAGYKKEFPRLSYESRVLAASASSPTISRGQMSVLWTVIMGPADRTVAIPFKDLDDRDSLAFYARQAVVSGFLEILPDRRFHPDYLMTRRNLAHYLFTYSHDALPDGQGLPSDVMGGDPQAGAIQWSIQSGLMAATGSRFEPDRLLTGSEALTILSTFRDQWRSRHHGR